MYGMMPEREDRRARESAADEQVVQAEQSAVSARREEIRERHHVDAGCGDVSTEPVKDEAEKRELDLIPQLGVACDVGHCGRGICLRH